ncbi:MAG: hypothetical protein F4058_02035 [Rhodothermaceae bacterium]|nr:hypothetical protein [Rhodothermaceae bacterium]MYI84091.1 hypothetical protein [Rhodothermaceae bacterium]
MSTQTKDRALACAMTAVIILVLWLVAAWVEVQSHTPEFRELPIVEGFEPAVIRSAVSSSVPEAPVTPPPAKRRIPQITRAAPTPPTASAPVRRVAPSPLLRQEAGIELEVGRPATEAPSAGVTTRMLPQSLDITIQGGAQAAEQGARQTSTISVTQRAAAPNTALRMQTPARPERVLQNAEAKKIIEWMRLSRSELPPGIQRHVDYQPGNLSATSTIDQANEIWEIYLMARMPSEELHIVIVRGEASYYIVDPSFKREGRRFRLGVVRRSGGEITGITSEERAASSAEVSLHYEVFLAWWDKLRLTLE